MSKKKVGLYFGSFNPIHWGHLNLATYLTNNALVDEVWFVVSPCNPLKKQSTELIDEYIRLEMVVLAIKNNPSQKACDIEFTLPIPSYTIDTLHALSAEFADVDFTLIIGSDNALLFERWKNSEQILAEYPIFVYPRRGYDFTLVGNKYPQMKLLNTPFYDISSTEIRKKIAEGKDVSAWLHADVNEFISENNLYQSI